MITSISEVYEWIFLCISAIHSPSVAVQVSNWLADSDVVNATNGCLYGCPIDFPYRP